MMLIVVLSQDIDKLRNLVREIVQACFCFGYGSLAFSVLLFPAAPEGHKVDPCRQGGQTAGRH